MAPAGGWIAGPTRRFGVGVGVMAQVRLLKQPGGALALRCGGRGLNPLAEEGAVVT